MADTFLTGIDIKKVRHLQNISIPLSATERKHLILTGKNGSGKTSVLEQLKANLEYLTSDKFKLPAEIENFIKIYKKQLSQEGSSSEIQHEKEQARKDLDSCLKQQSNWTDGVVAQCDYMELRRKYQTGKFIIACYEATRFAKVTTSQTIEHIELKDQYKIIDSPGKQLVKYMVALKATQAFALQKHDTSRSEEIENWFQRFESILRTIFEDPTLKLDFDIDTFKFSLLQEKRERFDFNSMSSGYAAVFAILNDLIMRLEKKGSDTEGIVLIDEIDTHLHLDLQKKILSILIQLFPNIQFIVSTHSPFVLSSTDNAVVFDLENQTLVQNGLANLPYEGIVEGYFGIDRLAENLRAQFERYKVLVNKQQLSDADYAEIMELETKLDEIPDYLAWEMATEYQRLKLEFAQRD